MEQPMVIAVTRIVHLMDLENLQFMLNQVPGLHVAEACGISKHKVFHFRSGQYSPTADTWLKTSAFFIDPESGEASPSYAAFLKDRSMVKTPLNGGPRPQAELPLAYRDPITGEETPIDPESGFPIGSPQQQAHEWAAN